MKLVRFTHHGSAMFGRVRGDQIEPIETAFTLGPSLSGEAVPLENAEILAPTLPSKIVAVGLNYKDHADELGMAIPAEPVLFMKPPSSLLGPGGVIIYPEMSQRVDHEAELAIVIGREAKNVPAAAAADYILGFTCANDITARDLQERDGQWTRAKSFDTFCPLGPSIETSIDAGNLAVKLFKNGVCRQDSSTGRMIFDVCDLVSFISRVLTMLPGDVILTVSESRSRGWKV